MKDIVRIAVAHILIELAASLNTCVRWLSVTSFRLVTAR